MKFKDCPLVMVEWEDSRQPDSFWRYLAKFKGQPVCKCVSVGWLVRDDDDVKVVAPNVADASDKGSEQISGMIDIPVRCVVKISHMKVVE